MKLPVCWSCGETFRWRELLFVVEGKKTCKKCGAKQYTTTHSKWRTGVVVLPAIYIPAICRLLFGMSLSSYLFLTVLVFVICFAIVPFYYQFTEKRQPLF
ncbi:TIGR04104 family putative zinc finger protein [Halalkalibacter flavus]|uniref:TIGR04104 family putative zinc finger protein n=1 Tax=Halalkalibacter flavus TaxID=3090668 RepID=UPI002FCC358B